MWKIAPPRGDVGGGDPRNAQQHVGRSSADGESVENPQTYGDSWAYRWRCVGVVDVCSNLQKLRKIAPLLRSLEQIANAGKEERFRKLWKSVERVQRWCKPRESADIQQIQEICRHSADCGCVSHFCKLSKFAEVVEACRIRWTLRKFVELL